MSEADFEKLGVFYLGKEYDLQKKATKPALCLYHSKDLVTHAVCIGMTGSGKTGLCIGILEEAAIDGIPVIAIDPKGDISNILLQFPDLKGSDFAPWIDPDQARRSGVSPADYAEQQAQTWRTGLSEWDQTASRIQRLKDSADFTIYTPGSSAGTPVSVIKSFSVPPDAVLQDTDIFRERISTTASSLLALLGIDADPLRSREHILLSNILKACWQNHQDLSLYSLIQLIQKPPLTQIGALDLETFYPSKERFELALNLNNLLASPGFDGWMQGEPLDLDRILYTNEGKPRVSVFSISHLGETERMFFVSLLLSQLVSWMRAQSGTTSLRSILYMDEIFGYFPPVANPPSKTPLLTLMKQGRAFGVGVLLASQNPVDLDYKGLANAGTWFIGRLQTERDKMRVLDGLEGAATNSGSGFDRASMDKMMSALGGRVFLMNNVHDDQPVIFMSRWTLSYLRGPMTREQIKSIMAKMSASSGSSAANRTAPQASGPPAQTAPAQPISDHAQSQTGCDAKAVSPPQNSSVISPTRPLLPPTVKEYFLPVRKTPADTSEILCYRPTLLGIGNVHYTETRASVDTTLQYSVLLSPDDSSVQLVDWSKSEPSKVWVEDLQSTGNAQARFDALPPGFSDAKSYTTWNKEFTAWLYNSKRLIVWKSEDTGEYSKPRESERDFRIRLAHAAREQRDRAAESLKAKFGPKLATLDERRRRAQQVLETQQLQAKDQQLQSAISVGATVLGAFMGRKTISRTTISHATSAARSVGRSMREQQDVQHAEETMESVSQQIDALNLQFASEMKALDGKFDPMQLQLTEVKIAPKKTNVTVALLGLAWAPVYRRSDGSETPAWKP